MNRELKLRGPLILCLFLLLAGIMLVVALNGYFTQANENNYRQSLSNALEQAALNVNDRMGSAVSAMRYMMYSNAMTTAVAIQEENITMSYQLQEIKDLRALVQSALAEKGTVLVRVYMNNFKLLTREGINFFPLDEVESFPASTGAMEWQPLHRVATKFFDQEVISLRAALTNPYRYGEIGVVLVIDQTPERYQEILDAFALPDDSAAIALTDESGAPFLIGGTDRPDAALLTQAAVEKRSSGVIRSSAGEEMVYLNMPLEYAGWRLCLYTPRSSLLAGDGAFQSFMPFLYMGILLLVLLFCMLLFVFVYTRKMHQYIRHVNQTIQATGDVQNHRPAGLKDLFDLDGNISELLETIDTLTKRNYESQLRERSANLRMLQAQINPHFLYNSLSIINWKAIEADEMEISEVTLALSTYYRTSLNRGETITSLENEVNNIRAYLRIQLIMHDDSFTVEEEIDTSLFDCRVPKLILQPLVENAIDHGLDISGKEEQKLWITVGQEGETLLLSVRDNGCGMEQEKAEKIITYQSSGYGVRNVNDRIVLLYGENYRLRIHSTIGEGTCVEIRIPKNSGGMRDEK